MTELIRAERLTRYYGGHCAVDALSFSLHQGEILGFLGPNGAGKTTTMQLITGNLAPSAGSIHIKGIDLQSNPGAAKLNLGYLPDTPPLYKELTVDEFLSYCAKLHRIPQSEQTAALQTTKARCGLNEVAHRLIGNLSKGYQQRVGIAQAILHNPAVIILDEPTIGLDPIQIKEIRLLIRELGQDHGIILSSHILSEIQESCTHVQIIQQGLLILKTSIQALNYQLQANRFYVKTRVPVAIETLKAIPGVTEVSALNANEVHIQHNASDSAGIQEAIAAVIIAGGFGLLELVPVQTSLEDEFIRLTQSTSSA